MILRSFFFNDTATTEIYTLSLHDALPRTTDIRRLLDGLFYVVRTGCQWRHLPPPPAFPPWPTGYGYFTAFLAAGGWGRLRPHLPVTLRGGRRREASPPADLLHHQSVK